MTELVELFSIRLLGHQGDDNEPTEIRDAEVDGIVVAHDLSWIQLYKPEPEEGINSILPDGTLSLTGPHRCIDGVWEWCVKLSLRDKNRKLVYCRGFYSTSSLNAEKYHDELVSAVIPGKDGYAVMHFIRFKRAVQATVEVSLVSSPETSAYYGHIRAYPDLKYNNVYQKKYFRSTLFHASAQKPKEPEGKKIQLSRLAVAVPLDGKLIIEAELFDSTTKSGVANGKVSFYGQTSGISSQRIGGIEVKISWCDDPIRLLAP